MVATVSTVCTVLTVSTTCVDCVAATLALSLPSVATVASTFTVIDVVELSSAVTNNVYTVAELAVKAPLVPPTTVMSPIAKPVTSSLNVKV